MGSFDSAPHRTGRQGPRAEGARWLSGVLIVAAIGATTVAVRVWPARIDARPAGPASVSARAVLVFHGPAVLVPARVSSRLAPPPPPALDTDANAARPQPPETAAGDVPSAASVPSVPAEPGAIATARTGLTVEDPAPLLPARRLDFAFTAPAVAGPPSLDEPFGPRHAFVELPAVMVTRAVVVAGRGIRTGLRATSSVFKAAF